MSFPRFTPGFTIQRYPSATSATPATNSRKVADVAEVAATQHQAVDRKERESEPCASTTSLPVGAVELVFVQPREKITPLRPEFPPCPSCSSARYWITAGGKVVCGTCGVTRFILAAISFHPVS
jgi:hypothetical protein